MAKRLNTTLTHLYFDSFILKSIIPNKTIIFILSFHFCRIKRKRFYSFIHEKYSRYNKKSIRHIRKRLPYEYNNVLPPRPILENPDWQKCPGQFESAYHSPYCNWTKLLPERGKVSLDWNFRRCECHQFWRWTSDCWKHSKHPDS